MLQLQNKQWGIIETFEFKNNWWLCCKKTAALGWSRGSKNLVLEILPRKMLFSWVCTKRPIGAPEYTYGLGLFKSMKKKLVLIWITDMDYHMIKQYGQKWFTISDFWFTTINIIYYFYFLFLALWFLGNQFPRPVPSYRDGTFSPFCLYLITNMLLFVFRYHYFVFPYDDFVAKIKTIFIELLCLKKYKKRY